MSKRKKKKNASKSIGLLGTTHAVVKNKLGDEIAKPVSILVGVAASRLVSMGIDKIIKEKEGDGKMVMILKKSLKPVALLGAGGTLVYFGKNKALLKHL